MNRTLISLIALAALALVTRAANAQMIGIEPIIVTLPATPPGNVFEAFYPNHFDLERPKRFTFFGALTNADLQQPAFVDLWFDWIDPRLPPGPPSTSGVFPIDLAPGELRTIPPTAPITFLLPFCPPQVSIHIQNNGPGQPVIIDGTFIHECLIPEPSTMLLGGFGGIGLIAAARRRRAV